MNNQLVTTVEKRAAFAQSVYREYEEVLRDLKGVLAQCEQEKNTLEEQIRNIPDGSESAEAVARLTEDLEDCKREIRLINGQYDDAMRAFSSQLDEMAADFSLLCPTGPVGRTFDIEECSRSPETTESEPLTDMLDGLSMRPSAPLPPSRNASRLSEEPVPFRAGTDASVYELGGADPNSPETTEPEDNRVAVPVVLSAAPARERLKWWGDAEEEAGSAREATPDELEDQLNAALEVGDTEEAQRLESEREPILGQLTPDGDSDSEDDDSEGEGNDEDAVPASAASKFRRNFTQRPPKATGKFGSDTWKEETARYKEYRREHGLGDTNGKYTYDPQTEIITIDFRPVSAMTAQELDFVIGKLNLSLDKTQTKKWKSEHTDEMYDGVEVPVDKAARALIEKAAGFKGSPEFNKIAAETKTANKTKGGNNPVKPPSLSEWRKALAEYGARVLGEESATAGGAAPAPPPTPSADTVSGGNATWTLVSGWEKHLQVTKNQALKKMLEDTTLDGKAKSNLKNREMIIDHLLRTQYAGDAFLCGTRLFCLYDTLADRIIGSLDNTMYALRVFANEESYNAMETKGGNPLLEFCYDNNASTYEEDKAALKALVQTNRNLPVLKALSGLSRTKRTDDYIYSFAFAQSILRSLSDHQFSVTARGMFATFCPYAMLRMAARVLHRTGVDEPMVPENRHSNGLTLEFGYLNDYYEQCERDYANVGGCSLRQFLRALLEKGCTKAAITALMTPPDFIDKDDNDLKVKSQSAPGPFQVGPFKLELVAMVGDNRVGRIVDPPLPPKMLFSF